MLLQSKLADVPVRELMGPRTATVEAEASLRELTELLYGERLRAVPVVEAGRVVGLVTVEALRQVPVEKLAGRRCAS
ncbi:CBS domain-containing protein [Cystobacter fuscus]